MNALSAQDGSLAANDKVTLAKLVKLGLSTADQAYPMSAQMLAANGLSTGAIVAMGLALAGMAACIADHARLAMRMGHAVVMAAVQVPMQPEVGQGQQLVIGVAKARRAGLLAIARVATQQAGPVMGDGHRGMPAGLRHLIGLGHGP